MEDKEDEAEDKIQRSDLDFPSNNEIGHGEYFKTGVIKTEHCQ